MDEVGGTGNCVALYVDTGCCIAAVFARLHLPVEMDVNMCFAEFCLKLDFLFLTGLKNEE